MPSIVSLWYMKVATLILIRCSDSHNYVHAFSCTSLEQHSVGETVISKIEQEYPLQEGMIDPYIKEKITHVAVMDEEALKQDLLYAVLPTFVIMVMCPFLLPLLIVPCLYSAHKTYQAMAALHRMQLYFLNVRWCM